jgi:hypothetical protein
MKLTVIVNAALAIALVIFLTGLAIHTLALYRYLTWASTEAIVQGEPESITVRVGKSLKARLKVKYDFHVDGRMYSGTDVLKELPADRKITIRYSASDPAKNANRFWPSSFAWNLLVGGGGSAFFLNLIRLGLAGKLGGGKSKKPDSPGQPDATQS